MPFFEFDRAEKIGAVQSVDTGTVVIRVTEAKGLSKLQVNHMAATAPPIEGQILIGLVSKNITSELKGRK